MTVILKYLFIFSHLAPLYIEVKEAVPGLGADLTGERMKRTDPGDPCLYFDS